MFSDECCAQLKYYVYMLVDPRDGHAFYVGKGKNNRVYDHINDPNALVAQGDEGDGSDLKAEMIRSIHRDEERVTILIHRHGMDERTAFEVEAALIDVKPGLTNKQGGHGANDFGAATPGQLMRRYDLEEFEHNPEHNLLIIKINRAWDKGEHEEVYEMVRYAWRVNLENARRCDYVLAVAHGIVRGVFVADEWLEANWREGTNNFPGREPMDLRYGFNGEDAEADVVNRYLDKRIPNSWLAGRGSQNPVRYSENILADLA